LPQPLPLLTIAGSDSGGAAGAQADLKTWASFGSRVHGMSALTAVTAQNSARVVAVHYLPTDFIATQIDAVLSDYGAAAIKTGFLGRVDIIEAVADRLAYWRQRPDRFSTNLSGLPVVIDPVLVNHRGESMFGPEVATAYRELLFPLADLVTPNRAEAALLEIAGEEEQGGKGEGEKGARGVGEQRGIIYQGAARVLIKGHRRGEEIVDVYWESRDRIELSQPRIATPNTHGSGDTLSAAICAFVAQGHDWLEAIRRAQAYTHAALRRGAAWQLGSGHGPLGHASDE